MRVLTLSAAFAILALGGATTCWSAQIPKPAPPIQYKITGSVTESGTNRPVSDAQVTVTKAPSGQGYSAVARIDQDLISTTKTGGAGTFEFDLNGPCTCALKVAKDGYVLAG